MEIFSLTNLLGVTRLRMERFDDKTIKVVLTASDMVELELSYENLDYAMPETQKALSRIIRRVNAELSANLLASKLFVEAYPYADGGCILIINKISSAKQNEQTTRSKLGFDTPIIYRLKNISVLTAVTKRLASNHLHIITKSALYLLEGEYYLMLYTYCKMDSALTLILSEYGNFAGKGVLASAIIKEHSTEIIAINAIETLAACL